MNKRIVGKNSPNSSFKRMPTTVDEAVQHLESIGYFGPNTRRKPVYLAMRNLWTQVI